VLRPARRSRPDGGWRNGAFHNEPRHPLRGIKLLYVCLLKTSGGVLHENWMTGATRGGEPNPSELSEARIKRLGGVLFGMVFGLLTARINQGENNNIFQGLQALFMPVPTLYPPRALSAGRAAACGRNGVSRRAGISLTPCGGFFT
jgi:hypothetical protein